MGRGPPSEENKKGGHGPKDQNDCAEQGRYPPIHPLGHCGIRLAIASGTGPRASRGEPQRDERRRK
jgi:hypothetical protein